MGISKYIAAVCFATGFLHGAMITSGNVTFHWESPNTPNFGPGFSLTLDDGFSFSGGGNYNTFQYAPQCYNPDQCGVVPPAGTGLNLSYSGLYNPQFNGYLDFTYSTFGHPTAGVDNQVFLIPFTARGVVVGPDNSNPYAPYFIEPCALPGAVNPSKFSCSEPLTGLGTALVRVGYVSTGPNGITGFFLKDAVLTFSETPEPSTWLLLALPTIVLLFWPRRQPA